MNYFRPHFTFVFLISVSVFCHADQSPDNRLSYIRGRNLSSLIFFQAKHKNTKQYVSQLKKLKDECSEQDVDYSVSLLVNILKRNLESCFEIKKKMGESSVLQSDIQLLNDFYSELTKFEIERKAGIRINELSSHNLTKVKIALNDNKWRNCWFCFFIPDQCENACHAEKFYADYFQYFHRDNVTPKQQ